MPQVPDVPLEGLYGQLILDHYRNPRNRRQVQQPDVEAQEFNPFCGDEVAVRIKLDAQGRVAQVGCSAQGCSIIQASTSMMSQAMEGKTPEELKELAQRFLDMMKGKMLSDEERAELGDLEALLVVRQYPVRIKCALLPWTALEEGLDDFRHHNKATAGR